MSAVRLLYFTVAVLLGAGIGLSGWNDVHWLLYVPTALLLFAGATGFCPTLALYRKLGLK